MKHAKPLFCTEGGGARPACAPALPVCTAPAASGAKPRGRPRAPALRPSLPPPCSRRQLRPLAEAQHSPGPGQQRALPGVVGRPKRHRVRPALIQARRDV